MADSRLPYSSTDSNALFEKPAHLIATDDRPRKEIEKGPIRAASGDLIQSNDISITGVTPYSDLTSRLELMCAEIEHPVTLFCFYDILHSKDADGNDIKEMVRIDSNIASVSLHWCCEALRICAGPEYCRDNDIDHASLFRNPNGIPYSIDDPKYESSIRENIETLSKARRAYYNPFCRDEDGNLLAEYKPKFIRENGEAGYIEYYCQILGFHELIFPLVICGRILGVIFCGQVSCGRDCKTICKNIRSSFLLNNPQLFNNYDFVSMVTKGNEQGIAPGYFFEGASREQLETQLRDNLINGDDRYKKITQYIHQDNDKARLEDGKWTNQRRASEVLSIDEYGLLIVKASSQMAGLTTHLQNRFIELRKSFIGTIVRDKIRTFYIAVSDYLDTNTDKGKATERIVRYWNLAQQVIQPLTHLLPIRDIQLFGANEISSEAGEYANDTNMPCVAYGIQNDAQRISSACEFDLETQVSEEKEEAYKFEFSVYASDRETTSFVVSSHNLIDYFFDSSPDLLERIVICYPEKGNKAAYYARAYELDDEGRPHILFYPARDNLPHSHAIVFSLWSKTPHEKALSIMLDQVSAENFDDKKLKEHKQRIEYEQDWLRNYLDDGQIELISDKIHTEVFQLATLIFYVNGYLMNSILQHNASAMLRFFKHEVAQVCLGFGSWYRKYMQNRQIQRVDEKKFDDVRDDFHSTRLLLNFLDQNIEMLIKPIEDSRSFIDLNHFLIFHDVFIKWGIMFEKEIRNKALYIDIPDVSGDDPYRPKVFSDERYIEQIVFNLISNAIKYSFWGSNIYLDCCRPTRDADYQLLTVRDYGTSIPEGKRPYDFSFRDKENKELLALNAQGSGIGLYVVKKICDLLDLSCTHTCNPVADCYVPLIDAYLDRPFHVYDKDEGFIRHLRSVKDNLGMEKMREIVNERIADVEFPNELEIMQQIRFHTYEVVFTIKIPNRPNIPEKVAEFYRLLSDRFQGGNRK